MPHVKPPASQADANNPHYQLTLQLLSAFQTTWKAEYAKGLADPMTFSRLSMVALGQLAATVAVDIGMTQHQFTQVCRASFDEAYKQAPKFGE